MNRQHRLTACGRNWSLKNREQSFKEHYDENSTEIHTPLFYFFRPLSFASCLDSASSKSGEPKSIQFTDVITSLTDRLVDHSLPDQTP